MNRVRPDELRRTMTAEEQLLGLVVALGGFGFVRRTLFVDLDGWSNSSLELGFGVEARVVRARCCAKLSKPGYLVSDEFGRANDSNCRGEPRLGARMEELRASDLKGY
ncbi:hypothetical protein Droror1_Dr00004912 [Drosera rotundifolia]